MNKLVDYQKVINNYLSFKNAICLSNGCYINLFRYYTFFFFAFILGFNMNSTQFNQFMRLKSASIINPWPSPNMTKIEHVRLMNGVP